MIELYASTSPNVHKIEIMLEECDLEYVVRVIDVHRGEQFGAEYTSMNPMQKVPVIVDRSGADTKPLTVFESGAILIYLAQKTGRFLPPEPAAASQVMQWLMVQLTSVGPTFGQFNHFMGYAPTETYSLERYTSQSRRLYNVLEDRLAESEYLGGDEYSLADIATFPWIRVQAKLHGALHKVMDVEWEDHPHIARWFRKIAQRQAVLQVLNKVDRRVSSKSNASRDELDRYYQRGDYALSLKAQ